MNEPQTIDVPSETIEPPPAQPVAVRDARQAMQALEPIKPQVTAAQAKIQAIADLTQSAYARASELTLTTEESAALQAEFPDEAFRTGAAGKDELIYLEHFALRERLNKVLGLGQWAIVPRSRWAEDYEYWDKNTKTYQKASRVYVEAMLVIRGCFVAESIGDMTFYPKNQSTNYGDAVEGAQSEALRRCCKNFGIGLQAWSKAFQEGWWTRKRGQAPSKPSTAPPQQQPAARPLAATGMPETFPVVTVDLVKEVHSKPGAPKPWTAYFITFNDGIGTFEAATFDKKISALANELAGTRENALLKTQPGKKPGTREIRSLERNGQPEPRSGTEDDLPFDAVEPGVDFKLTPQTGVAP